MTQEAENKATILANSNDAAVQLGVLVERMSNFSTKLDDQRKQSETDIAELKALIEAGKTKWSQIWGPLIAAGIAIAGVYGSLTYTDRQIDYQISALQAIDAQSAQQRSEHARRIERLEIVNFVGEKR